MAERRHWACLGRRRLCQGRPCRPFWRDGGRQLESIVNNSLAFAEPADKGLALTCQLSRAVFLKFKTRHRFGACAYWVVQQSRLHIGHLGSLLPSHHSELNVVATVRVVESGYDKCHGVFGDRGGVCGICLLDSRDYQIEETIGAHLDC